MVNSYDRSQVQIPDMAIESLGKPPYPHCPVPQIGLKVIRHVVAYPQTGHFYSNQVIQSKLNSL